MTSRVLLPAAVILLISAAGASFTQSVSLEAPRDEGASITGAFEGWFRNPDGTFNLLVGYYNRNRKQELNIPVGPNNRIEPGGPDRGQPTHFMIGRNWGMFAIKVPADFGQNKLTWTITANGQTTAIPLSLKTDWEISPLVEASVGNTPPTISFEEKGPSVQGPQGMMVERPAKSGAPMPITVWVTDDDKFTTGNGLRPKVMPPPVSLKWTMFRGPAAMVFSPERPMVEKIERAGVGPAAFAGKATTTATFTQPGEYILHVVANDYSGEGGGGFQCCWTNAQVKVSVKP
jgi:hypothetical protein